MSLNDPKSCLPCAGMDQSHLLALDSLPESVQKRIPLWILADDRKSISRTFIARNFQAALDAVNAMGVIAEEQSHHPDFHLTSYRKLHIVVSTHKLGGLTENDFVLAELLDQVKIDYSPKWLCEHRQAHASTLLVNFHDACMYGRDLALLDSPTEWLNSDCIHFALKEVQVWLEEKGQTDTLLLDPSQIAFLMFQCHEEDDFQDFCRGCQNFHGVSRLLIPVNDTLTSSSWAMAGKGTHWSLLLLERDDAPDHDYVAGYHFDSMPTSGNLPVAQAVANKVVWASAGRFGSSVSVVVQSCQTPMQVNGYDCGVHVIMAAKEIAFLEKDCRKDKPQVYEARLLQHLGTNDNSTLNFRKNVASRIRNLAARFHV
jgi:4a-hydroxytetrahydrobiopterin dehydratase